MYFFNGIKMFIIALRVRNIPSVEAELLNWKCKNMLSKILGDSLQYINYNTYSLFIYRYF